MDDIDRLLMKVTDGTAVRPLLKTEDLKLVRRALLGYIKSGLAGNDRDEIILLWYRLLRRTGLVKKTGLRKGWRDCKDGCGIADRVVGRRCSCLECPFGKCLLESKERGGDDST